MTLKEIGKEYRKSEKLIDTRIRQLQKERSLSKDPAQCRSLDLRIKLLGSMYRDAKELAAFCEHYYEKGYHSNERYKI